MSFFTIVFDFVTRYTCQKLANEECLRQELLAKSAFENCQKAREQDKHAEEACQNLLHVARNAADSCAMANAQCTHDDATLSDILRQLSVRREYVGQLFAGLQ